MKNKSLMLLMVAAGCGLVAMLGVQQLLSGGKPTTMARILVAKTEIEAGVKLDQTNVGGKDWPIDAVPEGAVTTEEEFADRALKHRIGPGQPILKSELGNKGEFGPEIQIPTGMRLSTVAVTATMTHSGILRPGNYVDVNAVIEVPVKMGGKRMEIKPVLQCIKVFAVDSRIAGTEESKDPKAKDAKNVTFLVYPQQAMLLALAEKQSHGALQFVMRSGPDKALTNTGDISAESLSMLARSLQGVVDEAEQPAPAEKTAAKPKNAFRSYLAPETSSAMTSVGEQAVRRTWKIEIFQGDQREVQELDWPDDGTQGPGKNLLKFFDRRQKSEQDGGVDAQSTSLIRRQKAAEPAAEELQVPDDDEINDKK